MLNYTLLRKLAKTPHYQDLYNLCKELKMNFFENNSQLTSIQITFLKYVCFYYSIFMDVSIGDVSERVLEDEIYEDSYALYKNKKDKKTYKQGTQQNTEENIGRTSKWLFKSQRK